MSNVLILGDPHIGKNIKLGKINVGSSFQRTNDQIKILDWTLETALKRDVSHIVITGDVFEDPKPNLQLLEIFMEWLGTVVNNNIEVHIVIGNHDILRTGTTQFTSLDIINKLDLPVYIHKDIKTVYINNVAFTMLPFADRHSLSANTPEEAYSVIRSSLEYEAVGIPLSCHKVLIGHLSIAGAFYTGDEVDNLSKEIFLDKELLSMYDVSIMGHVHKHQVFSESPFICHIGSMDISNFGEADQDKFVYLINTTSGSLSNIKIPTVNLCNIEITLEKGALNSTELVISQLDKRDDLAKSIVRLEVILKDSSIQSIDRSKIKDYLLSKNVWMIVSITESKKIEVVKKSDLTDEILIEKQTKLEPSSAINVWAQKVIAEDEREEFLKVATSILGEIS